MPSEQNFENFPARDRFFFKKTQKILIFFNALPIQAAITPQLQIDVNSLPNDPSMGYLVTYTFQMQKIFVKI